jgi:hypothetical protein
MGGGGRNRPCTTGEKAHVIHRMGGCVGARVGPDAEVNTAFLLGIGHL